MPEIVFFRERSVVVSTIREICTFCFPDLFGEQFGFCTTFHRKGVCFPVESFGVSFPIGLYTLPVLVRLSHHRNDSKRRKEKVRDEEANEQHSEKGRALDRLHLRSRVALDRLHLRSRVGKFQYGKVASPFPWKVLCFPVETWGQDRSCFSLSFRYLVFLFSDVLSCGKVCAFPWKPYPPWSLVWTIHSSVARARDPGFRSVVISRLKFALFVSPFR